MFDYSDDEISNNFIYNRSRKKSGSGSHPKSKTDSHERPSLYGYANEAFISDFQLKPDGFSPSGFRNGRIADSQAKVGPLFQRTLLHSDVNAKPFPPRDNESDHPDSFFRSMQTAVQMAQFFSLLPVTGYEGPNYKSLRFRWIHWKTVYFVLFVFGTIFIIFCMALTSISLGFTYDKSSGLVFFGASLVESLLLLHLATNWKKMSADFAEMELKLFRYKYPKGISRNFKIYTFVFMTFALVEHILSKVAQLQRTIPCARDEGVASIAEAFFANYYFEVFSHITYSFWIGIILLIFQLISTFTWNFTDLLLGLIAWTISARFRQFNEVLFKFQGQEKDHSFWKMTRTDYNELSDLTRKVDSYIQKLMLLSLGDNLYFICIQLLKGLKKSGNLYETAYFLWSVGFLIGRTCFVAFTAAGIHDESKEAKTVLYSVPDNGYCAETRRFLTQLSTNDVALTGCKFFSITRGLILTIAGTIVTYEVILVQFNTGEDDWPSNQNRTQCLFF